MSALNESEPLTTLLALRQARRVTDDHERLVRLVVASARETARFAAAGHLLDRLSMLLRRERREGNGTLSAPKHPPVANLGRQMHQDDPRSQARRPAA